jgi:hypothetical protein
MEITDHGQIEVEVEDRIPFRENQIEVEQDGLDDGIDVWSDGETRMFYPENPLVTKEEGIHIRIESKDVPLHPNTSEEWKKWIEHWEKTIGVGKVISEGRDLQDMWQSFIGRTEFTPSGHLVTDVIGRKPEAESWTKTAPMPDPGYDHRKDRMSDEDVKKFGDTLQRYYRQYWIPEIQNISVFPDGITVYPPPEKLPILENLPEDENEMKRLLLSFENGGEFFEHSYIKNMTNQYPWQSEPMMVSDKIQFQALLHPHLKSGVHILVGLQGKAPRRPWRDVNKALEGLVAAEICGQILEETEYEGKSIADWTSIRATGSWFGGFTKLSDDDRFNDSDIPRKWLKRHYRGAPTRLAREGEIDEMGEPKNEDWEMSYHPHVYGGQKGELMRLTQRPRHEGGVDWEGIEPINHGARWELRDQLNKEFVERLRNVQKVGDA